MHEVFVVGASDVRYNLGLVHGNNLARRTTSRLHLPLLLIPHFSPSTSIYN